MAETTSTLTYLAQRLHEKSTYMAIPLILSLAGTHIDDATTQMISTIGIGLSGLLLALIPESNAERTNTLLSYLAQRLQEPTTYTAIPVLLGLIGITTNIDVLQKMGQVGVGVGAVLATLLAERNGIPGTTPTVMAASQSTPVPSETSSDKPPVTPT